MFSYLEERTESPVLDLSYHLSPWDEPIFHGNTAVIAFRPGCSSARYSLFPFRFHRVMTLLNRSLA